MLVSIKRAELRPLLSKYGPIKVHLYPTWDKGAKVKASKVKGCVISKRIHAIGELSKQGDIMRVYRTRSGIATHTIAIDTDALPEGVLADKPPFVY